MLMLLFMKEQLRHHMHQGEDVKVNEQVIPRCIYTSPEIASVGLNEENARKQYGEIRIGTFAFSANGKALILNQPAGQVKVIVEPQYQIF
ncbi:hypothetical protein BsIDN1_09490 [Bacillus safensis]|uniref:Pyridine nucleotide-disulphide oxidoreductase dimerisation domain-containing protein n=1 Tax=Bacillus safensis TaxID=561879 RepID=A0A5S9M2X0_BACIA|nr:hypothetical protein BsIDN1_09490 [Bacillus safensis]